jgi:hypothetical protein
MILIGYGKGTTGRITTGRSMRNKERRGTWLSMPGGDVGSGVIPHRLLTPPKRGISKRPATTPGAGGITAAGPGEAVPNGMRRRNMIDRSKVTCVGDIYIGVEHHWSSFAKFISVDVRKVEKEIVSVRYFV